MSSEEPVLPTDTDNINSVEQVPVDNVVLDEDEQIAEQDTSVPQPQVEEGLIENKPVNVVDVPEPVEQPKGLSYEQHMRDQEATMPSTIDESIKPVGLSYDMHMRSQQIPSEPVATIVEDIVPTSDEGVKNSGLSYNEHMRRQELPKIEATVSDEQITIEESKPTDQSDIGGSFDVLARKPTITPPFIPHEEPTENGAKPEPKPVEPRKGTFGGIPAQTSDVRKQPPLTKQSVDIGDFVHRRAGNETSVFIRRFEDVGTSYHSFKRAVERFPERPCMGKRSIDPKTKLAGEFQFHNYGAAYKKIRAFAAGIRHLGVQPHQHLGIYSRNRIEWQIASEACHTQSIVTIALYDTLGEEASLFIMNHGEVVCLCIGANEFKPTMKIASQCQFLKHIVTFDKLEEAQMEEAKKLGLTIHHQDDVEKLGAGNPIEDTPPTPDTIATIMYTSGTTGMPKGVMLTHMNIVACITGVVHSLFHLSENDVLLSYLPLAHILERVAEMAFFQHGAAVGFFQGDIRELPGDIKTLRPTLLPAVPRVLDRFYERIHNLIATLSPLKKFLFEKAFAAKKAALKNHTTTPIWDFIVFGKLKDFVGGRLRGMLSGGAPLSAKVHEFLRIAFDCPIVQGYGLTETCAGGTIQVPYDISFGHIGPPIASCEIKLVSVPEMNYFNNTNPPFGEICIRGPNVSIGYYKDPEKTAEVFDEDGWFHTGDIGSWNENGTLAITDRLKNIFKLSQGEYVAAEALEIKMGTSQYSTRLWVYGDSFKAVLIGVVVVNVEAVKQWARDNQIDATDIQQLIKDQRVNDLVLKDLENTGKTAKLKGFEFVKAVHLVAEDFDTFGGTTPTLKLKRNVLKDHFQKEIDSMYAELDRKEEEKKQQAKK